MGRGGDSIRREGERGFREKGFVIIFRFFDFDGYSVEVVVCVGGWGGRY